MDERKLGPAKIINLDDETKNLFGLMALHVLSDKPEKSPLLEIEPDQRDDGLTEILFEKLSTADEIIRYLITHVMILDLDIIPLFLFREVMKEAERLYHAVVEEAKKKHFAIGASHPDRLKGTTISVFENMKKDFRFIKINHLNINYKFSYNKDKKDFITSVVDNYFKTSGISHLPKSKMVELMSHIKE